MATGANGLDTQAVPPPVEEGVTNERVHVALHLQLMVVWNAC